LPNGERLKPLTGRAYLKTRPRREDTGDTGQGSKGRNSRAKGAPLPTPALPRIGARRAAEKISKTRPDAKEILRLVLASLDDMKAEETVTLDLTDKTSFADAMVVTSGRSNRHVGAVAGRVLEDLGKAGVPDLRVEGMPHCDWVLIDAGDIIVHVFRPEVRAFYSLEKMWAPARSAGRKAS
jgi:ribosome-associated protein